MNRSFKNQFSMAQTLLALGFFASGAAALIYQVCWNRAFYGTVGVDIDSVTVIVSCFMLGIGIGGALGGYLADRFPLRRIELYMAAEGGLCLFGLMSLALIDRAGDLTLFLGALGSIATPIAVFGLLLIPTVLMGMTLPVLSLLFQQWLGNMGAAVGKLYFANTLGAALGAYFTPFFLFLHLDLLQSTWLAAGLNLLVILLSLGGLSLAKKVSKEAVEMGDRHAN